MTKGEYINMKYKINPVDNTRDSELDKLIDMMAKDFLADIRTSKKDKEPEQLSYTWRDWLDAMGGNLKGNTPDPQPGGSNPKQYSLPPGAKELQDLIEYRQMPFSLGNIFKACYRMGVCDHSDNIRDINKIIWFAERIKAELTKK
jgi:hypothetical protein